MIRLIILIMFIFNQIIVAQEVNDETQININLALLTQRTLDNANDGVGDKLSQFIDSRYNTFKILKRYLDTGYVKGNENEFVHAAKIAMIYRYNEFLPTLIPKIDIIGQNRFLKGVYRPIALAVADYGGHDIADLILSYVTPEVTPGWVAGAIDIFNQTEDLDKIRDVSRLIDTIIVKRNKEKEVVRILNEIKNGLRKSNS